MSSPTANCAAYVRRIQQAILSELVTRLVLRLDPPARHQARSHLR